jgi:hypothetical protein
MNLRFVAALLAKPADSPGQVPWQAYPRSITAA